jgi:hypothetical protein
VCITRTESDLTLFVNVILNCYCHSLKSLCHIFQEFINYVCDFALRVGGEYEHIQHFILHRAKIYKNTQ